MLRRNNYETKDNLRVMDLVRSASALSHLKSGLLTTEASMAMLRGLSKVRARVTACMTHVATQITHMVDDVALSSLLYSITPLSRSQETRDFAGSMLHGMEQTINESMPRAPLRFLKYLLNAYANTGSPAKGLNQPLLWAQV